MSGLTTWALEDAVVSADSMRARGYGAVPVRSSYARYHLNSQDIALLVCIFALTAASAATFLASGAPLEFFPVINLGEANIQLVASCIAYPVLLFVPTLINLRESLKWHNSLSKI